MVEAVKRNFPQREIADAAFALQTEIDAGERGRGRRQRATPRATMSRSPILRIDPALERKQIGRVQAVRARRDAAAVEPRSPTCEAPPPRRSNLMPPLLDCARAHATEGEIISALQDVCGSYTETPVF